MPESGPTLWAQLIKSKILLGSILKLELSSLTTYGVIKKATFRGQWIIFETFYQVTPVQVLGKPTWSKKSPQTWNFSAELLPFCKEGTIDFSDSKTKQLIFLPREFARFPPHLRKILGV